MFLVPFWRPRISILLEIHIHLAPLESRSSRTDDMDTERIEPAKYVEAFVILVGSEPLDPILETDNVNVLKNFLNHRVGEGRDLNFDWTLRLDVLIGSLSFRDMILTLCIEMTPAGSWH